MPTWLLLHKQLAFDDELCMALAAIMWREAIRWPNEELIVQVARTRNALAGLAGAMDAHGVRVTTDAIILAERCSASGMTRVRVTA